MAIGNVDKTEAGYTVQIKNIGGFTAPVNLMITYIDGSAETMHETPAIWEKGLKQATINITINKKISAIKLDGGIFMDANEADK